MAPVIAALLPLLLGTAEKVIDKYLPDTEAKNKAQAELLASILASSQELESAAASIIKEEAASKHWLAANWRPLTMVVFVGLIVARWFGWAAPNLSEAEYLKLWSIVEFSMGGYVFMRSGEKMLPQILKVVKKD
jgi:hypothetical protein